MNCSWTRRRLARYLSGELDCFQQLAARFHLQFCEDCFEEYDRRQALDDWTAHVCPVREPSRLQVSIRLAVSREIAREEGFGRWVDNARTAMREALGPLAIRSVGVMASAILLFGLLMPDIWKGARDIPNDVPLTYMAEALFTRPSIEVMGPYVVKRDATVLAFIDMTGGVYDIALPDELADDLKLRAEVANALLFTEFHPATRFGRPVRGQVLIHFAHATVKG